VVDAGDYRGSWEQTGQLFRDQVTAEQWLQALQQARAPRGAVSQRAPSRAQRTTELPGAPAGEYVVLLFQTQLATGAMCEQVAMVREAGAEWRVIGYFVQP
jgi:hypothetical protein